MPEHLRIPTVVVTGSRNFRDGERIEADLRALLPLGLRRVAQGGNGVDKQFASEMPPQSIQSADALTWFATHRLHLEEATYRVDKQLDGRWPVCGPRRNRRMLRAERPALVLAYPTQNSKGTWSCIEEAWRLRIPALVWIHWARGGDANRIVIAAMAARGVNLVWSKEQIAGVTCDNLGISDRDGHRVFVGDPDISDRLPEELDG